MMETINQRVFALGLGALALASTMTNATAQTVVAPRPAAQNRVVPATIQGPQHRYFGSLVQRNGQVLTIALRNGRLLQVNAAAAFALNRVAEPFFRGKPIVVDGAFGADGVFYATAVRRGAPLAVHWGLDH
jgi:hypothetical protein